MKPHLFISLTMAVSIQLWALDQAPDPILWTPPAQTQLFVERVSIDEYPRRLGKARERAAELAQEPGALKKGLTILKVNPGSQGEAAKLEPGDIVYKLDEQELRTIAELNKLRSDGKEHVVTYVSPKIGEQKATFKSGAIGVIMQEAKSDDPIVSEGPMDDPRWAEELKLALVIRHDDPDLAETLMARAVAAGFPRSEALRFAAATLALRSHHYSQVMGIVWEALKHTPKDEAGLRSMFFLAAISDYKLQAALDCARAAEAHDLKLQIPAMERFIAAHKALPEIARRAPAPSVAAKAMFFDDMMVRAEPIVAREYAAKNPGAVKHELEPPMNELTSFAPSEFRAPGGKYARYVIGPAVKNVYWKGTLSMAPFEVEPNAHRRHMSFIFLPHDPNTKDKLLGYQISSAEERPMLQFAQQTPYPFYFANAIGGTTPCPGVGTIEPKRRYRFEMYALNGRMEVFVDGVRILYAPLDTPKPHVAAMLFFSGVKAELSDVTLCELLTPQERKQRVDPEINKAGRLGWTRLHRIVQWAPTESVAELLTLGANLNPIDEQGRTPLMLAAESDHMDTVKLLVEKGAKLQLMDKKGSNVYEIARMMNFKAMAEYLLKADPKLEKEKAVKPPKAPTEGF